jgi:hypothetical protein
MNRPKYRYSKAPEHIPPETEDELILLLRELVTKFFDHRTLLQVASKTGRYRGDIGKFHDKQILKKRRLNPKEVI